jgi:hypothetical protein
MSKATKQALQIAIDYMNDRLEDHDCKYQRHPATEAERINILADIETVKEALAKQEQEVPEGYKLVMVPNESPTDEPDWDECIRQAEVSTGLKVERNTLSIVIREVRRWLIAKQEQGEPVAWQSVSTEMLKFLNGEAPLDGVWFGEDHPIEKGAYWWRKRLNTTPQPKQEQRSVSEHLGEPVAITITGKLGNIYSFTGDYSLKKGDNVYTTPQQRTWVGLTDEEANELWESTDSDWELMKRVEAKLKEKNTIIKTYPEKDKA